MNSATLISLDTCCQYIPCMSSCVALTNTLQRLLYPHCVEPTPRYQPYIHHVLDKSSCRVATTACPIVGNVGLALYDLYAYTHPSLPPPTQNTNASELPPHAQLSNTSVLSPYTPPSVGVPTSILASSTALVSALSVQTESLRPLSPPLKNDAQTQTESAPPHQNSELVSSAHPLPSSRHVSPRRVASSSPLPSPRSGSAVSAPSQGPSPVVSPIMSQPPPSPSFSCTPPPSENSPSSPPDREVAVKSPPPPRNPPSAHSVLPRPQPTFPASCSSPPQPPPHYPPYGSVVLAPTGYQLRSMADSVKSALFFLAFADPQTGSSEEGIVEILHATFPETSGAPIHLWQVIQVYQQQNFMELVGWFSDEMLHHLKTHAEFQELDHEKLLYQISPEVIMKGEGILQIHLQGEGLLQRIFCWIRDNQEIDGVLFVAENTLIALRKCDGNFWEFLDVCHPFLFLNQIDICLGNRAAYVCQCRRPEEVVSYLHLRLRMLMQDPPLQNPRSHPCTLYAFRKMVDSTTSRKS